MKNSAANSALQAALDDFGNAPTVRALQGRIELLDVSADTKALLQDIAAITLNVAGKILSFGRKLLAIVFDLVAKFQNVGFGVIIALVLSAVLASIPLLGPAISALLTPILLAFGIARGALQDFRDGAIQNEIDMLKQKMAILSGHTVL